MNNTDTGAEWRWHRPAGYKSHLVKENEYRWPDARLGYTLACKFTHDLFIPEPNNDATEPCKNCLRSAVGRSVGAG